MRNNGNDANDDNIPYIYSLMPDAERMSSQSILQISNTTVKNKSFYRKNINRFRANDVVFDMCSFERAACVGARFTNVTFRDCDFTGAAFLENTFTCCRFIGKNKLHSLNLSNSTFIISEIENADLCQTTLYQCLFDGCSISGGDIRSITLEGSRFINCRINGTEEALLDVSQLNMEYILIDNCCIDHIILPPYQVGYVINGFSFFNSKSKNVNFYTDDGSIEMESFSSFIPDLINYYEDIHCFFPLANIFLFIGNLDKALEAIKRGVTEALDLIDFRIIKNYSVLLSSTEIIPTSFRNSIYNQISEYTIPEGHDIGTWHSYTRNIGEIRELLKNGVRHECNLTLSITTDLDIEDSGLAHDLYDIIQSILDRYSSSESVSLVEIRHNSPFDFIIHLYDDISSVLQALPMLYVIAVAGSVAALKVLNKIIESTQNAMALKKSIRTDKLDEENLRLQNEGLLLDNEKKKLEIEKLRMEIESAHSDFSAHICGIEHTLDCASVKDTEGIPVEVLHNHMDNRKVR